MENHWRFRHTHFLQKEPAKGPMVIHSRNLNLLGVVSSSMDASAVRGARRKAQRHTKERSLVSRFAGMHDLGLVGLDRLGRVRCDDIWF